MLEQATSAAFDAFSSTATFSTVGNTFEWRVMVHRSRYFMGIAISRKWLESPANGG